MLLDATVDGRTLRVLVRGKDGHYTVTLDGKELEVDLCDTGSDFVSLLIEGRSHEAGLEKRAGGYTVVLADDVIGADLALAHSDAHHPVERALHRGKQGTRRPDRVNPEGVVKI